MVIAIPGRSFNRGEVGREELLARTRDFEASRHLFDGVMRGRDDDIRLVEGDLDIDGPLALSEQHLAVLVVTGNLVVRDQYRDSDDPESATFVLGDMEADSVITAGWLNVGGSLLVHGGLIGDYNDCSATIGGTTRARFLHTEQHWFTFGGPVHADFVLGQPRGTWPASTALPELPASRYPGVLVPEVINFFDKPFHPTDLDDLSAEDLADLDDLLELNHPELVRRARRGDPVLA